MEIEIKAKSIGLGLGREGNLLERGCNFGPGCAAARGPGQEDATAQVSRQGDLQNACCSVLENKDIQL
jgi:hypothetical protein